LTYQSQSQLKEAGELEEMEMEMRKRMLDEDFDL